MKKAVLLALGVSWLAISGWARASGHQPSKKSDGRVPVEVMVKRADWLNNIADRFHTTPSDIIKLSHLKTGTRHIYPGKVLRIPMHVKELAWDPAKEELNARIPKEAQRPEPDIYPDFSFYDSIVPDDFLFRVDIIADSVHYERLTRYAPKVKQKIAVLEYLLDSIKKADFSFNYDSSNMNSLLDRMKMARDQYYNQGPLGKKIDSLRSLNEWVSQKANVLRNDRMSYEQLVENAPFAESQGEKAYKKSRVNQWGDQWSYEAWYSRWNYLRKIGKNKLPVPVEPPSKNLHRDTVIITPTKEVIAVVPKSTTPPNENNSETDSVLQRLAQIASGESPSGSADTAKAQTARPSLPQGSEKNQLTIHNTGQSNLGNDTATQVSAATISTKTNQQAKPVVTVKDTVSAVRSSSINSSKPDKKNTSVEASLDSHAANSATTANRTAPQTRRDNQKTPDTSNKNSIRLVEEKHASENDLADTSAAKANNPIDHQKTEIHHNKNNLRNGDHRLTKQGDSTSANSEKNTNTSTIQPQQPTTDSSKTEITAERANAKNNIHPKGDQETASGENVNQHSETSGASSTDAASKQTTPSVTTSIDTAIVQTIDSNSYFYHRDSSDYAENRVRLDRLRDSMSRGLNTDVVDTAALRTPVRVSEDPLNSYKTDSNFVIKTVVIKDIPVVAYKNIPKYLIPVDSISKIKAEFYMIRARSALERGDFKEGEKHLRKSLELNPNSAAAWMLHGDLYLTTGSAEKALKDYVISAAIDSTNPKVYYNMALLFIKANDDEKGFRYLSKAIDNNEKYLMAYMGRAALLMKQRDYAGAIEDYDHVLSINKYYTPAMKERGLAKMEAHRFAEAVKDFDAYLEIEDPNGYILYQRGIAKCYSKNLLQGCLDFSTALELGFKDAQEAIHHFCE
ncbi:MAG: tetratricopeptide repeat protein [Chitinophagales bacterium]